MKDLLVEFIGTFVFIGVIFQFASKDLGPFAIGAALVSMILFGGSVSGGHFNPAVSASMFVAKKLSMEKLIGYVVMQLVGGQCARIMFVK